MKIGKILSVAFGVLIIGFWVVPSWENIKILEKDVATLTKTKDLKKAATKLLQEEVKKGEGGSDSILKVVPFNREQASLIQTLQGLSAKTGFVFRGLNFGKGENASLGAAQTTVSFSVVGAKKRVPEFLSLVENSVRFLGTDSLSITIQEKDNIALAELNIVLYALSQELAD